MFSLLIRIFAGSFLRTASGEIAKGFGWVFSSATHILEALLLLAVLFGLWERHEAHSWHNAYDVRIAAEKVAEAKQRAIDAGQTITNLQAAEKFDELSQQVRAAGDSAIDQHIRTHTIRVRPEGPSCEPKAADVPDHPGQPADPGPASDLVATPPTEFRQLSSAALQGALRQRFLQSLIDMGLAVRKSEAERLMAVPAFGNTPAPPQSGQSDAQTQGQ